MSKHDYIKKVEGDGFLSVLNVGKISSPEKKFDEKNYTLMYVDSQFKDNQLLFTEKIVKTKHGFFIHLHKLGPHEETVDMKVYYKPEQTNELIIYIKQFLKQV
jgi:hypothetical protein